MKFVARYNSYYTILDEITIPVHVKENTMSIDSQLVAMCTGTLEITIARRKYTGYIKSKETVGRNMVVNLCIKVSGKNEEYNLVDWKQQDCQFEIKKINEVNLAIVLPNAEFKIKVQLLAKTLASASGLTLPEFTKTIAKHIELKRFNFDTTTQDDLEYFYEGMKEFVGEGTIEKYGSNFRFIDYQIQQSRKNRKCVICGSKEIVTEEGSLYTLCKEHNDEYEHGDKDEFESKYILRENL